MMNECNGSNHHKSTTKTESRFNKFLLLCGDYVAINNWCCVIFIFIVIYFFLILTVAFCSDDDIVDVLDFVFHN